MKEIITRLIHEAAERLGYEIYESSLLLKGENSRIYVKIDSGAGVSHLDCEKYSRMLSELIDGHEALPNYSLEVSSPGLNRSLRTIDEFRRFPGAPVKIVCAEGEARKVLQGSLAAVRDDEVTLATEKGETTVAFSAIVNAKLDY